NAADRDKEDHIDRSVGQPTPRLHIEPVHPNIRPVLTGRFMKSHQGIRQTSLTRFDRCFPIAEAEAYGCFAAGDYYGYNELFLFNHVANESDFAADACLCKNRFKRLDERSA